MSGSLPDCSQICNASSSPELSSSSVSTENSTNTILNENSLQKSTENSFSKTDLINSSISNLTAPLSQENIAIQTDSIKNNLKTCSFLSESKTTYGCFKQLIGLPTHLKIYIKQENDLNFIALLYFYTFYRLCVSPTHARRRRRV